MAMRIQTYAPIEIKSNTFLVKVQSVIKTTLSLNGCTIAFTFGAESGYGISIPYSALVQGKVKSANLLRG